MKGRNKTAIFLVMFSLLTVLVVPGIIYAQNPAAPTVVNIISSQTEPLEIIGLTAAGTDVLVYIDGNFAGLADVVSQNTITDNFVFEYPTMPTAGVHSVYAVSRDRESLLVSAPTAARQFTIAVLPAPTLIAPNIDTVTAKVKPLITGLSRSDTFVNIWIDGVYNGKTGYLTDASGTAHFAYRPFLNLTRGEHTATAVAEDRFGRKSSDSNVLHFRVEAPMPAPVIYSPVVNSTSAPNRPFITGVAKNDSVVRVYIDRTLYGQFPVENSQTGTAHFAYLPFIALAGGGHFAYAEAVDSRGKVSSWSNIVYFNVPQPTISSEAAG